MSACKPLPHENVLSLEDGTVPPSVTALDSAIELIEAADGLPALKIEFDSTPSYSGIQFEAQTPLDFSGAENAALLY